jgi:hypothetical protein
MSLCLPGYDEDHRCMVKLFPQRNYLWRTFADVKR